MLRRRLWVHCGVMPISCTSFERMAVSEFMTASSSALAATTVRPSGAAHLGIDRDVVRCPGAILGNDAPAEEIGCPGVDDAAHDVGCRVIGPGNREVAVVQALRALSRARGLMTLIGSPRSNWTT